MFCVAGRDTGGLAALLGGGGGGGAFGGFGSGVPPVADPETTYASQLTQLQVLTGMMKSLLTTELFDDALVNWV